MKKLVIIALAVASILIFCLPTISRACICGDANNDGMIDISDPIRIIGCIFSGCENMGDCVYPRGLGDANGDQTVDISDAVYLIEFIFKGGPAPHCYGM